MSVMRSSTLNASNVQIVRSRFQIHISREEVSFCASAVRIQEPLSVGVAANPFGENILLYKACHSIRNAIAAPLAGAKFMVPISLRKMDSQRVSPVSTTPRLLRPARIVSSAEPDPASMASANAEPDPAFMSTNSFDGQRA